MLNDNGGPPSIPIDKFRCERRHGLPSVEWILYHIEPVPRGYMANWVWVKGREYFMRFDFLANVNGTAVYINKENKIKVHFELIK
jgi:hypothetical protein